MLILQIFLSLFVFQAQVFALTAPEAVTQIREMQDSNRKSLERADRSISELLKKCHTLKLSDYSLRATEDSIVDLQNQKQEYLLRSEFLDQLVNKFTNTYRGQPLKDYLESGLIDLATTELGVGTSALPTRNSYWQFLMYTSVAVRELPEPIENTLKFVESYMIFSSISQPKKPEQFKAQRNYFNSQKSESGKPKAQDKTDED